MSNSVGDETGAVRLANQGGASATLISFLKQGMDVGVFDAVLVPMRVPAGDAFAYVLIRDIALLDDACPLPPIVAVQGGKVVSRLTRLGNGDLKVVAVMRPCELRATIELAKLGQTNLSNITLVSMDCPGALALAKFIKDPEGGTEIFEKAAQNWRDEDLRPICQICHHATMISGDLHLGLLGGDENHLLLISNSEKGDEIVRRLGLTIGEKSSVRVTEVQRVTQKRLAKREEWRSEFESHVKGISNLINSLETCINCHNCMRVCPLCYCRLCYFDSENVRHPADDYIDQAMAKGSLRLPPGTLLFHLGRMTHMSLTCVSCGACEDACPASIPIAQIFSFVADKAQRTFDYVPGRCIDDALPLTVYRENELHEVDEDE